MARPARNAPIHDPWEEWATEARRTLQTDLRTSENLGWTSETGSLLCLAVQLRFSPGRLRGETDGFKNADSSTYDTSCKSPSKSGSNCITLGSVYLAIWRHLYSLICQYCALHVEADGRTFLPPTGLYKPLSRNRTSTTHSMSDRWIMTFLCMLRVCGRSIHSTMPNVYPTTATLVAIWNMARCTQ